MQLFWLCIKIFVARIVDVTLATFVTVFTVKGKRLVATIYGFIDVIVWFFVVKEAINTNDNSVLIALSYAGGYAVGTFTGTTLCNNFINGKYCVQVILNGKFKNKVNDIRKNGFAVTEVNAKGIDNKKKLMLFIEVDKKRINKLKKIVKIIDDKAFFIINETSYVENGYFT